MIAICHKDKNIPKYMYGWYNALISLGLSVTLWNQEKESPFDFFAKNEPEKILTNLVSVTRGLQKCLDKRPNVKLLTRERELSGPGYDSLVFHEASMKEEYLSDLVFIGNPTEERVNLLKDVAVDSTINLKIFGSKPWPFTQYCGELDLGEQKYVYVSSKLSLDFSTAELNSRPFEIVGCEGSVLSNRDLSAYFENYRFFQNGRDIVNAVKSYEVDKLTVAKDNYSYIEEMKRL